MNNIRLKKKVNIFSIFLFLLLVFGNQTAYACRFWCAVGKNSSQGLISKQFLELPNSLKALGATYPDGWSVGYYLAEDPIIFRGSTASNADKDYDKAVRVISQQNPTIVFSHLRRASSGCVKGVSNPHSFKRIKGGKQWVFGHTGGIKKQLLMDLIGKEYLKENLPTTCTDNAPDSWIDSELYFILLLKNIEKNNFNVEKGLKKD